MNRTRLVRLAATLAVPLTILAGAVIPVHASAGACDKSGCTSRPANPSSYFEQHDGYFMQHGFVPVNKAKVVIETF